MSKKLIIEESCGNFFEDLGLENSSELLSKARLASSILKVIEERGLTQQQAADLLGTDQSYISKLKKGSELKRFTYDRLLTWLRKLDHSLTLTIESKSNIEVVPLS